MIIKSVNINTEKLLYRGLSQFPAFTINILLHVSRVFLRGHTLNCEITRKGYTTQASLNLDLTQGNNERDRCTNKKQTFTFCGAFGHITGISVYHWYQLTSTDMEQNTNNSVEQTQKKTHN